MKSHAALHIVSALFVFAVAAALRVDHETLGAAIVLVGGIAAASWMIFGTLWWLFGGFFRQKL